MEDDTIVAVSTPPGRGGIGLIRLSGAGSREIAGVLCPAMNRWIDRRATHAVLRSRSGGVLDSAVVTFFKSPRSYTGEDVVEISCHGNPVILDQVVGELLAAGARAARPGEFTLRAFLAGRIDLSQAEAVADLVEAKTKAGADLALQQLEGKLTQEVEPLRSRLLDLLAHITALVDFSEDEIPDIATGEVRSVLSEVGHEVDRLLAGAHQGQVLSHGVSLAIVGPPNAGKSSILNQLLGRERAIVTPIPGTTRDTLEAEVEIEGVLFRVVDTAGITDTDDTVERIGVERSHAAIDSAEVILLVVDASQPVSAQIDGSLSAIGARLNGHKAVVALNKSDLPPAVDAASAAGWLEGAEIVQTCALSSNGLGSLRKVLPEIALQGSVPDGFVVSNRRHIQSLQAASEAITRGLEAQEEGLPLDLISLDVSAAAESFGEILGLGIGDEVLDRVFSRFCIGK